MSKKIDFDIDPSKIEELFGKYSLRTLDSLDVVLMWVRKYRMDATNDAFRNVNGKIITSLQTFCNLSVNCFEKTIFVGLGLLFRGYL